MKASIIETKPMPNEQRSDGRQRKEGRRVAGFVFLILVQLLEWNATRAQVSVVQGRASTVGSYQRVASPMVLKMNADSLRGVRSSKGLGFGDLANFLCEDVSISSFAALVSEKPGGERTYTFEGEVRVHSGVDKNVGLTLFLAEGSGRILMILEDPKISTEEGADEEFKLETTALAKAASAIDQAKDLTLQIIVTVKND